MGQFSWITQDTNKSIRNNSSNAKKTTAYLHDNKGNVWEEFNYEGYGEFGGKDFFELLSEMNGFTEGNLDEKRNHGIDLYYGKDAFLSPNLTRKKEWAWINKSPIDCPNQGWAD